MSRHAKRALERALKCAALLVMLVIAQTVAISHDETQDSHPADGVCAICVGAASLSSANVSASPLIASDARPDPVYDHDPVPAGAADVHLPRARGPPRAS
jgi:hypothetical protein